MKSPLSTVSQLHMTFMNDSTVDDAAIISILLPILANASFDPSWAFHFFNTYTAVGCTARGMLAVVAICANSSSVFIDLRMSNLSAIYPKYKILDLFLPM